MKTLLSLLIVLVSVSAWSKQESLNNSFGSSDSDIKPLSNEELAYRLNVVGAIFILNSEGDKLINLANEGREWQFDGAGPAPLESNWRFQQKGLPVVALKQKWTLGKDGKISLEIAQYDDFERGKESEVKYGKLIKEEKFTLKNFAPVDWIIPAGSQKLVVRLTPEILPAQDAFDISKFPISGRNIVIFDRAGKLWADQINPKFPSLYMGVTSHQGSVFFSMMPFKGAKLIGEAKGGRIKVKSEKISLIIQSETPFVPNNVKANVYGIIKPGLRTESSNSVRTMTSSREEEFVKSLSGN